MSDDFLPPVTTKFEVDIGQAEAEIKKLAASMDRLAGEMEKQGARAAEGVDKVQKSAASSKTSVMGLAAGIGVAGKMFSDLTNDAENAALGVGKMQRATGGSAKDMSTLAFAAKATGVDLDGLNRSMGFAAKSMVADKFKEIGVEVRNADGTMRPFADIMAATADRFRAFPDSADKSTEAMRLFGKQGRDLLPLLDQGADGIRRYADQAAASGQMFTDAQIAQARSLKGSQREMQAQWDGLKISIGQSFMPAMKSATELLGSGAQKFRELNDSTHGVVGQLVAIGGSAVAVAGALAGVVTVAGKGIGMVKDLTSSVSAYTQKMRDAGSAGASAFGQTAAKAGIASIGIAAVIGYASALKGKLEEISTETSAIVTKSNNFAEAKGYHELYQQVQEAGREIKVLDDALANSSAPWDATQRKAWTEQRNAIVASTNDYVGLINRANELHAVQGLSADDALKAARAELDNKKAMEDTGQAEGDLGNMVDKTTKKVKAKVDTLDQAVSAMKAYFGEMTGSIDVEFKYRDAVQKAWETTQKNGKTMDWIHNQMDTTSVKGRENFTVYMDMAKAIQEKSIQDAKAANSSEVGRQEFNSMTEAMRRQMTQAGYSTDAVNKFIFTMGLTQRNWDIAVQSTGLDHVLTAADQLLSRLNGLSDQQKINALEAAVDSRADAALRAAHPYQMRLGLASGGIVQPRPGGTPATIAEGGKPEVVSPLDQLVPMIVDALRQAGVGGGLGGHITAELMIDGHSIPAALRIREMSIT